MVNQRALLIGINDYQSINDLKGCINDVVNMRDCLMTYRGFNNYNTRVVLDSRATADNVKARMEWLKEGAGPGDSLFLHFSGHGSQIRDRDGDELKDHKDEIICLYGMNWDEGFITDDYFDEWFSTIPEGVVVDVFFDCCNSGTGEGISSKSILEETSSEMRNRYLEPPLDIALRAEGEKLPVKRMAVASFLSSWFSFLAPTPVPELEEVVDTELASVEEPDASIVEETVSASNTNSKNIVVWSGCGEAQTSADAYIGGKYNGAFTYFWCKHMRDSGGNLSRAELLKRVKTSLTSSRFTQVPELTCNELSSTHKVLY